MTNIVKKMDEITELFKRIDKFITFYFCIWLRDLSYEIAKRCNPDKQWRKKWLRFHLLFHQKEKDIAYDR